MVDPLPFDILRMAAICCKDVGMLIKPVFCFDVFFPLNSSVLLTQEISICTKTQHVFNSDVVPQPTEKVYLIIYFIICGLDILWPI